MKVVASVVPSQPDVIEAILKHCGLCQSRSARAPPERSELVLDLDAGFAESLLVSADEADPSQELTYVDIATLRQTPICLSATKKGRIVLVFQDWRARLVTQAPLESLH